MNRLFKAVRQRKGKVNKKKCVVKCKKSFLLVLAVALTVAFLPVKANAALSYDADAAVTYAKAHYNDGVGQCASFVSRCIGAGGCTVSHSTVTSLNSLLINSGYCTKYELTKTNTYYVYQSKNSGKIAAGDPILFYCKTCGGWQHAALCAGFDSNGRALLYGHRPAWGAERATSIGGYTDIKGHTGSAIIVYSYRMIGKAHTHSYTKYYESGHPHKAYMKCSCGNYYYTGEENTNYTRKSESAHPHKVYMECSCGYSYYTGTEDTNYTRKSELAHPHKVYMECSCGNWYYTGETENMSSCSTCYKNSHPTGFVKVNGSWYLYSSNSVKLTGFQKVGCNWFYLDPNNGGKMVTGLKKIGNYMYYFKGDDSGRMLTGFQKINGSWYYFRGGDSGRMLTGFQKVGGNWFYLDPSTGKMATGFTKVGNSWYYFKGGDSGKMLTGWQKVGGYWYYFKGGNSGKMLTGWQNIGGNWYYFKPGNSGRMLTGTQVINGRTYVFNSSGVWVK